MKKVMGVVGACVVLWSCCFAGEDIGKGSEPEIASLVDMTAAPSSYVNNTVSLITGNYVYSDQDSVLSGPEPFVLGHIYMSGRLEKGDIGHGWNFLHDHTLRVTQPFGIDYTNNRGALQNKHTYITLYDARFGKIVFKGNGKASHFEPVLKKTGWTNAHGLSGRTHIANMRIHWESPKDEWHVTTGDGTKKIYARRFRNKQNRGVEGHYNTYNCDYHIVQERRPSGNRLFYEYNKRYKVAKITIKNHNEAEMLGWLKFTYDGHTKVTVINSDGDMIVYHLKKVKSNEEEPRYVVYKISKRGKPDSLVSYEKKTETHDPRITTFGYHNGSSIDTRYYHRYGPNIINGKKYTFSDSKLSYIHAKVRQQSLPVAVDGSMVVTHSLFYHRKDSDKENKTTVIDAYGNKTYYYTDDQHRLVAIERNARDTLVMRETFTWGEYGKENEGDLVARAIFDEKGQCILARQYGYDNNHNVVKESVWGNFSSDKPYSITMDSKGFVKEAKGADKRTWHYTYTDDDRNLKLSEEDPEGNCTFYEYKEKTDLVMCKLVCEGKKIKKRFFYTYDDNGQVVEEIVDDGTRKNKDDFSDISERKIKEYTYRQELPRFGGIKEIHEYCQDPQTKKKELLSSTKNSFTPKGLIASKTIFDSKGQENDRIIYAYDALDRVVSIVDQHGKSVAYTYDTFGRVATEKGPRSDLTKTYTYDKAGRRIKEQESFDGIILSSSYEYDYFGRKVAEVDPQGNVTRYSYDVLNRMTKIVYPEIEGAKGQITYVYRNGGRNLEIKDECGYITKKSYSAAGKLLTEISPDGTKRSFHYDSKDRLIETDEPTGVVRFYYYDFFNRVTKSAETYAKKVLSSVHMAYSAFHMLSKEGPTGEKEMYVYDYAGRKKSESAIGEQTRTTLYLYDSMQRVKEERYLLSNQTYISKKLSYDYLGRCIKEALCDEKGTEVKVTQFAYDEENNIVRTIASIAGKESVEQRTFLPHKLLRTVTDPSNHTTRYEYNFFASNAQKQHVVEKCTVDARGVKKYEVCNARGALAKVFFVDPQGQKLRSKALFYDGALNLVRIEEENEPKNVVTELLYGPMHRLEKITLGAGSPEEQITQILYNKKGQKEKLIHPDGVQVSYEYDPQGRVSRYVDSKGFFDYLYVYDASGKVVRTDNRVLKTHSECKYNRFGEIIFELLESNIAMGYSYDLLGRLQEVVLPDSSSIAYSFSSFFPSKVARQVSGKELYSYEIVTRDLSGNILEAQLPMNCGKIRYDYDQNSRKVAIETASFSEKIPERGFDAVGNVLQLNRKDALGNSKIQFEYDNLSQLVSEKGDIASHLYGYDWLQNRREKDGQFSQFNSLHELLSDGKTDYIYDSNGSRIKKDKEQYSYDSLSRLIAYAKDDVQASYWYDASSRRMGKTCVEKGVKREEKYLYIGNNEIGTMESGKITALRLLVDPKKSEIGNSCALEFQGKVYVPVNNSLGNIVQLLEAKSGKVAESYSYSAFGEERIFNSAGVKQKEALSPYRYMGKRTDSESGLVYFGGRYYDSVTGRFITQDPLGIKESPNLYAFAANNPLAHIDHYGYLDEQKETGEAQTPTQNSQEAQKEGESGQHDPNAASTASSRDDASSQELNAKAPITEVSIPPAKEKSMGDRLLDIVEQMLHWVKNLATNSSVHPMVRYGAQVLANVLGISFAILKGERASFVIGKDQQDARHTIVVSIQTEKSQDEVKNEQQLKFANHEYGDDVDRVCVVYRKSRGADIDMIERVINKIGFETENVRYTRAALDRFGVGHSGANTAIAHGDWVTDTIGRDHKERDSARSERTSTPSSSLCGGILHHLIPAL